MYMVGIEDRDYKENKVECKYERIWPFTRNLLSFPRVVSCLRIQHELSEELRDARTIDRYCGQTPDSHRSFSIESTIDPVPIEDVRFFRLDIGLENDEHQGYQHWYSISTSCSERWLYSCFCHLFRRWIHRMSPKDRDQHRLSDRRNIRTEWMNGFSSSTRCRLLPLETNRLLLSWLHNDEERWSSWRQILLQCQPREHGTSIR